MIYYKIKVEFKKYVNVYDIVDDVGKLDKFLRERKKIYKSEKYEIIGE